MENDYYKQYEPFFGSWYIKRFIGAGSYGKVFEIEKKDALDMVYTGALKAISVPASAEELDEVLLTNNMDPESAATVFRDYAEVLNREISLLSKLKGHSNIVSYEDHELIPHKDGPGWDIFIRMELLTSLTGYRKQNKGISRRDVVRLGIDLCSALEVCQKYNIIHRDIKPANIFISDTGDFKLGDFGVARTASAATGASTRAGTPNYMAPEVFRGEKYTSNVDIYSLGLVMYQLLNDNRMPFYPPRPQVVTTEKQEQALAQRLSGMVLPAPAHADGRLAEIILKACAPRPADRYESPAVMKQALEAILYTKEEGRLIYPDGDTVPASDTSSSQKPPDRSTANDRSVMQKIFPPDMTSTDDTATERVTPPEEESRRQEEAARAAEEEHRRKVQEAKEAELVRIREENARAEKEMAAQTAKKVSRRKFLKWTAAALGAVAVGSTGGLALLRLSRNQTASSPSVSSTENTASSISESEISQIKVTFDSANGTLCISGTGSMTDYNCAYDAPWKDEAKDIQRLVVKDGVTSIGAWAIYGCSHLTAVELPSSVISIGDSAFAHCSRLQSIIIPAGVTRIGESAFASCGSLQSVEIPASVTSIQDYAFAYCVCLKSVTICRGCRLGNIAFPDDVKINYYD